MQADEAQHLGKFAGAALGSVARRAYDLHSAIAGRVFSTIGHAAEPVRVVHDGVAGFTYQAVSRSIGAGGWLAGAVGAERSRARPEPARLVDDPRTRAALGFLNGAHGDLLERDYPALAIEMTVRARGKDVSLGPAELREAFPDATPRLAVFLPGLVETEDSWRYRAERHYGDREVTFGSLLHRDLGYTPVWLRYNTGRHISDNGRDLAALMDGLVDDWPMPVEDVVLIGHSMGGLVARSALAQAGDGTPYGERHWPGLVRDTITLGSPHLGAPLEQGVNALGHALSRVAELRWIVTALASRSVGIKDLRFGNLLEEEWVNVPPDARRSSRVDTPLHAGARHFVVLATLVGTSESRVGDAVGDLLVRPKSACGDSGDERRMPFEHEHICRLQGLHHFDLLSHPAVYEQIRGWLTQRPEI
jgi:pimeloyl-ACP methyl ester carboxylesterase